MANRREEPPYEGGSQPVRESPPEVPHGGRTVGQVVVLVIAALVVIAGLVWFLALA